MRRWGRNLSISLELQIVRKDSRNHLSCHFTERNVRSWEKGLPNIILLINDRTMLEPDLLTPHPMFFSCYCLFCKPLWRYKTPWIAPLCIYPRNKNIYIYAKNLQNIHNSFICISSQQETTELLFSGSGGYG